MKKYIVPIIAGLGLLLAIYMIIRGNKPVPPAMPVAQPAVSPYETFIAGAGIIEAETENISIGSTVAGIVTDIYVKPGKSVTKGQPLFKIDDRDLQAQLAVQKAVLAQSEAKLTKLKDLPRPEDVNVAIAAVKQTQAALADAESQLKRYESLSDTRAVSEEDLTSRRYAAQNAKAKVEESQARLDLLNAGTWQPDIDIAKAELEQAKAQMEATLIAIDRLTVRAPVNAQVLQIKVRPGEFAPANVVATPLMLLGNVDKLHVRVDIDENDAWRFEPNSPAVAFARGNADIQVKLLYVRTEPYILPKRSLTGESTERVDTRVLQAIYSFDDRTSPLYVGQLMDVYIKAPPAGKAIDITPSDSNN